MKLPKLSIVIPFFNEENTVTAVAESLIVALEHAGIPHEVLLVDNGSSDATRQRAKAVAEAQPAARLVVVAHNHGYGGGVLAGLAASVGDVLGFITGDGQVKPDAVVTVYRRLVESEFDFCKAIRQVRHDGWQRAVLSQWGNRVFRWCFPMLRTVDINGSPKLFTRPLYERLRLSSTDWFLDAEIVIKSHVAQAAIGEVGVESPPRQAGESHVRWSTVIEFLRNLARYRWGHALTEWQAGSTDS